MEERKNKIKKYLSTNENINYFFKDKHINLLKDNNYELFINNVIFEPKTDMDNYCLGTYYWISKDDVNMVKYYLIAIDKGNVLAMCQLGRYHYTLKKYDDMLKYYHMAINKKNSRAMFLLGKYYYEIKNYDEMLKYYMMALDNGNIMVNNELGHYYYTIKNYDDMIKYYLIGIDNGSIEAMNNLGYYYYEIKNYKLMKKYYLMAIDAGNNCAMENLGIYYYEIRNYKMFKMYTLMAINEGSKDAYDALSIRQPNTTLKFELAFNFKNLVNINRIIDHITRKQMLNFAEKECNAMIQLLNNIDGIDNVDVLLNKLNDHLLMLKDPYTYWSNM